jgi:chromate transporter
MTRLTDLAALFLKLGVTSFGGPAVHIAMMEDEVVTRRRWLTHHQFLDLLGATNLIPGPNSTEMAIHVGFAQRGWPGLLVAGASFVLPATLIVTVLAWAYVRFGDLPESSGILYAVKPVVLAVIVQALWRLGRSALTSWTVALVGLAAGAAAVVGANEIAILAGAGAVAASLSRAAAGGAGPVAVAAFPVLQAAAASSSAIAAVGLWPLFGFFVKVGSILFGSGYVLLAFLHRGLVEQRGWLTESQLLDAVAVGQITPGPLSTTATFIGYLLAGIPGAAVATAGMFLPAFVFVALSAPLVTRLRRSPLTAAVLDGVNVASLALMAVVTVRLATAAVVDPLTGLLAAASAVALIRFGINSAWIVLAAAAVGAAAG